MWTKGGVLANSNKTRGEYNFSKRPRNHEVVPVDLLVQHLIWQLSMEKEIKRKRAPTLTEYLIRDLCIQRRLRERESHISSLNSNMVLGGGNISLLRWLTHSEGCSHMWTWLAPMPLKGWENVKFGGGCLIEYFISKACLVSLLKIMVICFTIGEYNMEKCQMCCVTVKLTPFLLHFL